MKQTIEDKRDEHQVSITQGGAYVAYANGSLQVSQIFDQTTKEIVVEVTDKAGLTYTETYRPHTNAGGHTATARR